MTLDLDWSSLSYRNKVHYELLGGAYHSQRTHASFPPYMPVDRFIYNEPPYRISRPLQYTCTGWWTYVITQIIQGIIDIYLNPEDGYTLPLSGTHDLGDNFLIWYHWVYYMSDLSNIQTQYLWIIHGVWRKLLKNIHLHSFRCSICHGHSVP